MPSDFSRQSYGCLTDTHTHTQGCKSVRGEVVFDGKSKVGTFDRDSAVVKNG